MATAKKKKPQAKKATPKPKGKEPTRATAKRSKEELERVKREAWRYYVEHHLEQKEIAQITGISENTISAWKKENDWDADKELVNIGPEKQMRRVIKQYDALLTIIEKRPPPTNVANTKEADILNKLADSVKKLQTEILLGHKTAVGKEFCQFLFNVYGKAKSIEIMELWHEWIMSVD